MIREFFARILIVVYKTTMVALLLFGIYCLYIERWKINTAIERGGMIIHGESE